MFKRVNNWHLSGMIVIVSVLSVMLIERQVSAQWSPPSSAPGGSAINHLVVTPMTESLDLNGYTITDPNTDATFAINPAGPVGITTKGASFDGNVSIINSNELCFDGDCRDWAELEAGIPDDTDWTEDKGNVYRLAGNVGIGLNSPDYKLHIYDGTYNLKFDGNEILHSEASPLYIRSGADIKFEPDAATSKVTFKSSGYVGIGTDTPNKNLHVYDASANAEIDIQSGASANHWGIYQDATTQDLSFWNTDNRVTFTDSGRVGVGTISPTAALEVDSTASNITSIIAKSDTAGTYALSAENTGVGGTGVYTNGYFGIIANGNQSGGAAILATKGNSSYAGMFFGTLRLYNSGSNSYLHLATVSSDPPDTDCDSTDERGRMIYNYVDDYLYICDYDPANPSGGGHKVYPMEALP